MEYRKEKHEETSKPAGVSKHYAISHWVAVQFILFAVVGLSACSGDSSDPSVSDSVSLHTIYGGIDSPLTRASGTTWLPGDAIGISSAASYGEVQHNVKYITENGDGVFVPAHPDTAISIRKSEGTVKLYAYYPFIGQNGAFPSAMDKTLYTITPDDQTPERQPSIDFSLLQVLLRNRTPICNSATR